MECEHFVGKRIGVRVSTRKKQIKFPRTKLFIFSCYEDNEPSQLLGSPISPVHRSGKHDLFTQLDKNKDGFLTKDEFTRPALFPLFDSDKDGRVTRQEGTTGMDKLRKREQEFRKGREALQGLMNLFR